MKVPAHVYTVAGMREVDPLLVHLVRDARGVAYSSMKMVLRQGTDDDPYRVRRPPAKSALRWMWINESFDRLARRVPSTLVRYETFVQHPADEIARIATEAGARVAPNELTMIEGGRSRSRPITCSPATACASARGRWSSARTWNGAAPWPATPSAGSRPWPDRCCLGTATIRHPQGRAGLIDPPASSIDDAGIVPPSSSSVRSGAAEGTP